MHALTVLLPLIPLLAPLSHASAIPNPFPQQPGQTVCPGNVATCPAGPDYADPNFKGFTGAFKSPSLNFQNPSDPLNRVVFPYTICSPSQGFLCPARLVDTVRRSFQIAQVAASPYDYIYGARRGDARDVQRCLDAGINLPILQGTTYVGGTAAAPGGNIQIFVAWTETGKSPIAADGGTAYYCGYSSPGYDGQEVFDYQRTFPPPS